VTAAARKLGISRRTLHRKLKEFRENKSSADPGSSTEVAPHD
jgi:transposase-like protein